MIARVLVAAYVAVHAGDYNVMPTDLDVYAPERWVGDALFRPEVREGLIWLRLLGTDGSQTHRWRKPDSNHWFRVTRPSFRRRLMSLLPGSLHAEKSARTTTDTTRMPGASRGTDGSNPVSSPIFSAGARQAACRTGFVVIPDESDVGIG